MKIGLSSRPSRRLIPVACLVALVGLATSSAQVSFSKRDGQMEIFIDGHPFATYVWNDPVTTRPYFKQVHVPGQVQVTRHHPPRADDIADHETFHPGIWWGFGDVGGNDYWRLKAKVVSGGFVDEPRGGKDRGTFVVRDRMLKAGSAETFCEQLCHFTILRHKQGVLLLCQTELLKGDGDFWLGDQEEMGLAVRVASSLAVQSGKGGRILDSDGRTDLDQIRTNQTAWCDYSGFAGGKFTGILVMNDPRNFRLPWWHAVDTGLLIANPLGESELNGRGKRSQNVLVKRGEPFRLRYGVLIHAHDRPEQFDPAAEYQSFLAALAEEPSRGQPAP